MIKEIIWKEENREKILTVFWGLINWELDEVFFDADENDILMYFTKRSMIKTVVRIPDYKKDGLNIEKLELRLRYTERGIPMAGVIQDDNTETVICKLEDLF